MNELVRVPGQGLAPTTSARKKGQGLALINSELEDFEQAMTMAHECQKWMQQSDVNTYLGCERGLEAKFLERAKKVHGLWFGAVPEAMTAHYHLLQVCCFPPDVPITRGVALQMLSVLFGTLSKKKSDDENAAMLLAACADLFNPINDAVGEASGLWKPISKHPLVLALAIKRLIATSVFSPSPSELRDAMNLAKERLSALGSYAGQFLALINKADEIIFTFDRPAWDAAYADVRSGIPLEMQGMLFGEEPDADDDGNAIAPSPRWQALNDLWEAKHAAEEAEQEAQTNAAESSNRIAACKTKPTKRTRKPRKKREE